MSNKAEELNDGQLTEKDRWSSQPSFDDEISPRRWDSTKSYSNEACDLEDCAPVLDSHSDEELNVGEENLAMDKELNDNCRHLDSQELQDIQHTRPELDVTVPQAHDNAAATPQLTLVDNSNATGIHDKDTTDTQVPEVTTADVTSDERDTAAGTADEAESADQVRLDVQCEVAATADDLVISDVHRSYDECDVGDEASDRCEIAAVAGDGMIADADSSDNDDLDENDLESVSLDLEPQSDDMIEDGEAVSSAAEREDDNERPGIIPGVYMSDEGDRARELSPQALLTARYELAYTYM